MKIRVGKLFELKNGYRKGFCAITPDLNDESSIERYLDELSVVLNVNKIYLYLIRNIYFAYYLMYVVQILYICYKILIVGLICVKSHNESQR